MVANDGSAALLVAAQLGYTDIVALLLAGRQPVDVDQTTPEGATALLLATEKNQISVAAMLINKGKADVNKAKVRLLLHPTRTPTLRTLHP